MGSGYFGKLPQRADFVTSSLPLGFAQLWEPFIEEGLWQSRWQLAENWDAAYMTMPAWHYSLVPTSGNSVLRSAVAGVFIPSIDAVERRYPLTVVSVLEEWSGEDVDNQWYARAEAILLAALEDEATFDSFHKGVCNLGPASICNWTQQDGNESLIDLDAAPSSADDVRSVFRCRAADRWMGFKCNGMPDAASFRYFVLPEPLLMGGSAIPSDALAAHDDDLEARS